MGPVFWTYMLGSLGAFCLAYIVVMTPVNAVRNVRAARAERAAAAAPKPDPTVDEHVAFPDEPPRPTLTLIRGDA